MEDDKPAIVTTGERSASTGERSATGRRIRFHYLKSPTFTTLHADGVIGGPTPRGDLHIGFFIERIPIPQQQEFAVRDDGKLEEIMEARVVREGILRELAVDVLVELDTAISLRNWLTRNIEVLQKRFEEADREAQALQQGDDATSDS